MPKRRTRVTASRSRTSETSSSPEPACDPHVSLGVDDEAAPERRRRGRVDVDHVELVEDRVRARGDQLGAAVAGRGQGRVQDDLGAEPGELAKRLREEAVVADRQADRADIRDLEGDEAVARARSSPAAARERPCGRRRPAPRRARRRPRCCGSGRRPPARRPSPGRARGRSRPRSRRAGGERPRDRDRDLGRVAVVLVEQRRAGGEMELGQQQQLAVGQRAAHRPRLLGEPLERRLGVAVDGDRLQRRDREGSHAQPTRTLSKASVTRSPCSPPSDRLEGAVGGVLLAREDELVAASAGSRSRRISLTPATGVT